MSYAASDTDIIATDADAAADENAAEVEVSADGSEDNPGLVLDGTPVVSADTADNDTEVESTEGG
ncbi:MAG: hypothetical protein NC419_09595, partial [Muribaculaceae bacterium]|nr:hypothetical protein [Muribaculaceae bacterium]